MVRHWGSPAAAVTATGLVLAALTAGCGAASSSAGTAFVATGSASSVVGSPSITELAGPSGTPSGRGSGSVSGTASAEVTVTDTLRPGDRGPQVLALQRRLTQLGYWLGTPDGTYGDLTRQAVIALQKAAGLGRDGVTGPKTRAALARGVRPSARTGRGHVVEVDLSRQLLLIVDNGRVSRILNTSTGSGVWYTAPDGHRGHATTPAGTFRVQWQVDGWHTSPLGRLYRPKYFHPRGIAVHGYTSVPAYPASHGCVRVSLPAMDMLWRESLMPVGTQVTVH
jgi:lipoprotein-anchoring transpeptidase ErfK/SrfK